MSKMIENEDGTIQIHYTDKDFTADLPEAGASAERMSSVARTLPSPEEIDKAVDDYGFQVPYNGTNDFYDKERMKYFKAGVDFVMKYVQGQ